MLVLWNVRRGMQIKTVIVVAILAIGTLSPTSVFAFKETPVEANQPQSDSAQPSKDKQPTDPALNPLEQGNPDANKGFELKIPGIGSLGVLPKLDFGLELLYGASEPQEAGKEEHSNDDLTIRGTLKHRF